MTTHSRIPPSSANEWRICTGWATMAASIPPPEEGEEARDGDASHEVAQVLLEQATGKPYKSIPQIGDIASNGVTISPEIFAWAKSYAETIMFDLITHGRVNDGIEHRVGIQRVHPECFGHVDYWLLTKNCLRIKDFKTGRKFVEVRANDQLALYGIGLIDELALPDNFPVVMEIYQPRTFRKIGPLRSWETTAGDLRIRAATYGRAAHLNLGPVSGQSLLAGSHCLYCKSRLHCGPALEMTELYMRFCDGVQLEGLSNRGLSRLLKDLDRASKYLEKLRPFVEERIKGAMRSGQIVPGWEMIPSVGREAWVRPVTEVIAAGKLCGLNLAKEDAVTPNQARTMGMPEDVLKRYSGCPRKGFSLVPEDPEKAYKAFQKGV